MEQRYRPKRNTRSRSRFDVVTNSLQARNALLVSGGNGSGTVLAKILGICVLMAALVAVCAVWFFGEDLRIHVIEVRNNQDVPKLQIIGASALMKEHILSADLNAAAHRIEALPGVKAAQISCTWKAGCEVLVQPSIGIAMWQSATDSTNRVWTDEQGRAQKALGDTPVKLNIKVEDGSMPVLGVPISDSLARALKELLVFQPKVIRYTYSSQYGLMFIDARGWKARLGVAEHDGAMQDKLVLLKQIGDQLAAKNTAAKVVDVRFVEAPFYEK